MLRCRPGDLAIVVNGFPSINLGRVVKCLQPIDTRYGVSWLYEGELEGLIGGRAVAVGDECLKPLRDPGDDALDEMLRPLPTQIDETLRPKRQIENA